MKYYTFECDKVRYIIDIDFFLNIISEQFFNIDILLEDLKINSIELNEIDINENQIPILIDSNKIEIIEITTSIIENIKKYYVNFLYRTYFKRKLNYHSDFMFAEEFKKEALFSIKYDNLYTDQEMCFMDILNSGDEKSISELEEFLELPKENIYHIRDLYHNIIMIDESLIKSNSINELIINLIMYIDKIKYDMNSLALIKQLLYIEEMGD